MKFFKFIVVFTLFLASCRSGKNLTDNATGLNKLSSKKVIKKHVLKDWGQKTIDTKLKVNFKNEKQNIGFSVRMKIKKDEVIWLKGTKIITVFKAKITPDKVSFYSPYYKNYIEGDFKMLEEILGVSLNFKQLQNLLLGQAMFDTSQKHSIEFVEDSYKLAPKKQADLFDVFYWVNPSHYKLNKQVLVNNDKEQRLDIAYPSYKNTKNNLFPESIVLKGKTKSKYSNIDILVKSAIFNEEIKTPFKIPEGYKEIEL